MTVTRINQFEAKPDCQEKLFVFLGSVVAIVKNSPGCISCQLLRSLDDSAQFAIIEVWDSVEAHQNAAQVIPPEMLAEARALFAVPPVGAYYQP